jgi:hypothetical protein
MRFVRAASLLAWALAVGLSGCATNLGVEPPAGVNLAGNWKLDPAASDDPQKLLEHMRQEAYKIIYRRVPDAPMPRPGQGGAAPPDPPEGEFAPQQPPPPGVRRPDPLRRSPMAHIIEDAVARGELLTVRQDPGTFVLDYGTSQRRFTPGARSVVSAEGGVGDQNSGWKGREYLIVVRAQLGQEVVESYGIGPDGKSLVEKLHIGSGELSPVTLMRVYRPASEVAPTHLPNND